MIDPATGKSVKKRVFMLVCTGTMARNKAKKICESFANLYPYPENAMDAHRRADGIRAEMDNKKTVLDITTERKRRLFDDIRPNLNSWYKKLERHKAILNTLNKWLYVDGSPRVTAELWCPKSAIPAVKNALANAEKRANSDVSTVTRPLPPAKARYSYFPFFLSF